MSLQSPLAKVRGLGSAKEGTHHWWTQRITAIALLPLSIWFIISLVSVSTMDYATVIHWIRLPLNSVLLLLMILALFHHAQLGIQVVIEDYIHSEWQKISSIILVKFLALFSGLATALSILKIFLGL